MNTSGIGPLLGMATQFLSGGAVGSLAPGALGGSQQQQGGPADPFSAIVALTNDVDGLASRGLGSVLGGASGAGCGGGALERFAGLLA